jgi:YVTN family beta-propeller protein
MKAIWKAACAAVLLFAALTIEIGCGDVYRPIATTEPVTTANPSGSETEVVLSCCLDPSSENAVTTTQSSVLTDIDVVGDVNSANKVLGNIVGSVTGPVTGSFTTPMAFDGTRTSVFTANTTSDSITQSYINTTTSGFSASTNTISLPSGSAPISIAFQYYGPTYTYDYVVNSGVSSVCPKTGSIGVINESTSELTSTICVGTKPVEAWIYEDQSKFFVLDDPASGNGSVYVVNVSKLKVTNQLAVGLHPFKVAQSANGMYIFVLNAGDSSNPGSISIINAQLETVNTTPIVLSGQTLGSATPIDIAQDPNYTDTSKNTQYNHVWVLMSDGTVNIYDASTPGSLTEVTSLKTLTQAQLTAGAYPTNLALMRDGTMAYVGVGNTDQIVAIDTSKLSSGGATTTGATTSITVGTHRSYTNEAYDFKVTSTSGTAVSYSGLMSETTTPTVTYVAVSRGGDSADLSKAYALTTTNTTYSYYDSTGNAVDPTTIPNPFGDSGNWVLQSECTAASTGSNVINCSNLYSGTAVVAAAANGTTTINTYITLIPAPNVVTYCSPGTSLPDAPMYCPLMTPQMLLGRS